MSEADNAWRIEVDGADHEVDVDVSAMTGKIVVRLDGEVLEEDRIWFSDKQIRFTLGSCEVQVDVDLANAGFSTRSSLRLDGRHVEPLRR
ncbi:PepSY domain-containing protein [Kineococcus sp. TBRC 1896]|uniref:PepSY domain-containing protein n=1 Tax=Kineococcus mangrovi TaxID=1660183 RepID=A0ABV4HX26_9ACTN